MESWPAVGSGENYRNCRCMKAKEQKACYGWRINNKLTRYNSSFAFAIGYSTLDLQFSV